MEPKDAKEESYEVNHKQRNRSGSSKSRKRGNVLTTWRKQLRKRVKAARRASRRVS